MDIKEILELKDKKKIIEKICVDLIDRDIDLWRKQYDGDHEILDRPDKVIGSGSTSKVVPQAKIVLTYQKKITEQRIAFLFGKPVKLSLNNKTDQLQPAFDMILTILKDNKIDYFRKKVARAVFVEGHAAELWYVTPDKKVKVMLLCKKNGDLIYPHYNDFGDMDAIARKYTLKDINDKNIEHVDVYTANKTIQFIDYGKGWEYSDATNMIEKIQLIYYFREKPVFYDVQTSITALEMRESKHDDTNEYFGNPILKVFGKPSSLPDKNEVGKMVEFDMDTVDGKSTHGDAEYLTWDQSPESIKLEIQTLTDNIYSLSSTANLSFSNVKGLGQVSAESQRFMLMDSIMEAANEQEIFGEGITREINLLKAIIGNVVDIKQKNNLEQLDIAIEFGNVIPQEILDKIKAISQARGGEAFMSKKAAVKSNPLIENVDDELGNLKEEESVPKPLGESYA